MRYIFLLILAMLLATVIGINIGIEQTFTNFVLLSIVSLALLVRLKPFLDRFLAFVYSYLQSQYKKNHTQSRS